MAVVGGRMCDFPMAEGLVIIPAILDGLVTGVLSRRYLRSGYQDLRLQLAMRGYIMATCLRGRERERERKRVSE